MKKLFQDLGYEYCGYWQRLSEHKGAVGKELWMKYTAEEKGLSSQEGPLVYVWIVNDQIIYVGETSLTIKKRMVRGHEGGFRGGSKSGIERQKSMLALNESRIDVYVAFKPLFSNYIQQSNNAISRLMSPTTNNMIVARKREEALIIGLMNPILNKR